VGRRECQENAKRIGIDCSSNTGGLSQSNIPIRSERAVPALGLYGLLLSFLCSVWMFKGILAGSMQSNVGHAMKSTWLSETFPWCGGKVHEQDRNRCNIGTRTINLD
jgi:hypothetical protein